MQLYKITESMQNVQDMIEDGVPVEQLQDTIELIEMDFKEKAESILFVIANMNAEVEACKVEENRIKARRITRENSIARLKEYLLYNMQELNSGKIDNGIMTASLRKGAPALEILDEDLIPADYKKITVNTATDKKGLLKALKELEEGETIPGAQVVQGKNTLTIK